jgi:ADP-ribosylglycohydrolase
MIGAIVGDVIGSVFEQQNTKSTDFVLFSRFSHFTDDTILTIAVADAVLHRKEHPISYVEQQQNRALYGDKIREYGRRYPGAGYGQMFEDWLGRESTRGYHSFGNGSAMRVSPVGFAFDDLKSVLREAKLSAEVTHNHPQGIKGAQAIASAIYLARTGQTKEQIRVFVQEKFGYSLERRLDDIRPSYKFDSTCNGSVPQAITAFLESNDFEDAIRKAVSLGGDSDTIACMAGGMAQAYYHEIPDDLIRQTGLLLTAEFREVIRAFNIKFGIPIKVL